MFRNREEAGHQLAQALSERHYRSPVVLGLPRGGVPVAAPVAERLSAPLDVLVAHKIGVPSQPELAMGAVAEDGTIIWDQSILRELDFSEIQLERAASAELKTARRRQADLRDGRPCPDLHGHTVILVDDGLATGSTMQAAVLMAEREGAAHVVVAVPVGSPSAVARLRALGAEVTCLLMPPDLLAVGNYYVDFNQVQDSEVKACLRQDPRSEQAPVERVAIPVGRVTMHGDLVTPAGASAIIVFAHGSGSSRGSPRNRFVASALQQEGLSTLLLDLLTEEEERIDDRTRELRFDIPMLAGRLTRVAAWLQQERTTRTMRIGYFGASTGAAAALIAAGSRPQGVGAVVSRGGRPDLAGSWLARVQAPTLLIVGGKDETVLALNRHAQRQLVAPTRLEIVPEATHLFEEPGALERVAELARNWFSVYLAPVKSR